MGAGEKSRPSKPGQTKPKAQQEGAEDHNYQKDKIAVVDSGW